MPLITSPVTDPRVRHFAVAALILVLAAPAVLATDEVVPEVFQDIDFESALDRAAAAEKIAMVDFYTTWCVPCKRMDAVTWPEDSVIEWVEEHAVAIRIDAEIETELAKRYKINTFPTLLLLRPDGLEIDRLTGFKSADELIEQCELGLAGQGFLARARQDLEESPEDLQKRMAYADALVGSGELDQAFEEYLRVWDAPLADNPGFIGVRGSFLLGSMMRLAREDEAKRAVLEQRRKADELAILAGEAEVAAEEAEELDPEAKFAAIGLVMGYFNLSRRLDDGVDRPLALYDRLLALGDQLPATRRFFAERLTSKLLELGRYRDVTRDLDLVESFRQQTARLEDDLPDVSEEDRQQIFQTIRQIAVRQGSSSVEALLAVGQNEQALDLVDEVLALETSTDTWRQLIESAHRSGDEQALGQLLERALADVDPADADVIRRAAAGEPAEEKPAAASDT